MSGYQPEKILQLGPHCSFYKILQVSVAACRGLTLQQLWRVAEVLLTVYCYFVHFGKWQREAISRLKVKEYGTHGPQIHLREAGSDMFTEGIVSPWCVDSTPPAESKCLIRFFDLGGIKVYKKCVLLTRTLKEDKEYKHLVQHWKNNLKSTCWSMNHLQFPCASWWIHSWMIKTHRHLPILSR